MTLVERLRNRALGNAIEDDLMNEAATRIEALEAALCGLIGAVPWGCIHNEYLHGTSYWNECEAEGRSAREKAELLLTSPNTASEWPE